MRASKTALATAVAGCLLMGTAIAMPVQNLAGQQASPALIQKTAWVCGPYRCWWRPGPRYWGPRWGWRGGWRGRPWRRW